MPQTPLRLAHTTLILAFCCCMAARTHAQTPRLIEGGRFEASGVVGVAGSNGVLFVDDARNREVFWMELGEGGMQKTPAVRVLLPVEVTDIEGITTDGTHFFIVGSQSKTRGLDGDGLVRFAFDPQTRRVGAVERVQGLKRWLAGAVRELAGTADRLGDEVLNIEAVAWDPQGRRLLLGLRAPIVDGHALVIPLRLRDADGPFTLSNLEVEETIRLATDGAGIRSLEFDSRANAFHLVTGAPLNDEVREFQLLEWSGEAGAALVPLTAFPRALKPEGVAGITLAGRPTRIMVFDTGRYLVMD